MNVPSSAAWRSSLWRKIGQFEYFNIFRPCLALQTADVLQKELGALAGEAYDRVRDAIAGLAEERRPSGCLKLTGCDGWRIRLRAYPETDLLTALTGWKAGPTRVLG
jgi:hypothetical protein